MENMQQMMHKPARRIREVHEKSDGSDKKE
jgi:hypothetical protein